LRHFDAISMIDKGATGMDNLLVEAVTASDAGDKEKAYLILARIIKQDSRNADAWHLLSTVVDNPQQQLVFTRRALAIDAHHVEARRQLAQLTGNERPASPAAAAPAAPIVESKTPTAVPPQPVVEPPTISEDLTISGQPADFLVQAEEDVLPDWLSHEDDALLLETADGAPVAESESEPLDLPDWLQEEPEPDWINQSTPEPISPPPAKATTPPPATGTALAKTPPRPAQKSPDLLMIGLIAATFIVLILFIIALANIF
jgi:hypothetical protein